MSKLKIGVSSSIFSSVQSKRQCITLDQTDFTDVAAVVLSFSDSCSDIPERIKAKCTGLPIFIALNDSSQIVDSSNVDGILTGKEEERYLLDAAADKYELNLLPPFFQTLTKYLEREKFDFSTPGHQGGDFFKKTPAGKIFYDFFGENIFKADMSSSNIELGALLTHQGAAKDAQKFAAKVFNADKTYFVLNGTSSANKVVCNALLTRGDLVLFDRNNHKSNHLGALVQAGATPIYLETARNSFGFIGGIDAHCFEENYIRDLIQEVAPDRAKDQRPFRLAIIQLGTYDGTICNPRIIVDRIGHLCDYILFDSAWVGYEQFIPILKDCSPLLLSLNSEDPGVFVTQSVHKQLAGFSQASQIHKKDLHILGHKRFCSHEKLNGSFMQHASTSPFYPIFAALEMNAKIHEGEGGEYLWNECMLEGIELRKEILRKCEMLKPFVPDEVDGVPWKDVPTEEIASNARYFSFVPGECWHGYENYVKGQYMLDPCKLLITTPGIDIVTSKYTSFGIPATILANYLRENNLVPEKCDLNSILFLLTPALKVKQLNKLVDALVNFERHILEDSLLCDVLPTLYHKYLLRYEGYTLRQLCQEMQELYIKNDMKNLQKAMFRRESLPRVMMSPQNANIEFFRDNIELIPISEARGRIAAEGALPFPPGVLCVVPGEMWGDAVQQYFMAMQELMNKLPGFSPEFQGVYTHIDKTGVSVLHCYVLTTSSEH